jgi:starch phosphorylase
VKLNDGFVLNTDAVMDVQVKRLHEYKRQLMCAMLITHLQTMLHDDPNMDFLPCTFVFGAKAAAGYKTAKRIIELICSLQKDIDADPVCREGCRCISCRTTACPPPRRSCPPPRYPSRYPQPARRPAAPAT